MVTCAPIACKHKVSGSVSLPSRGPFHLSLTVLSAIGHQVVFSLGRWSAQLPTGFLVSGGTLEYSLLFRISLTGLLPSLAVLSNTLRLCFPLLWSIRNPRSPEGVLVWALAFSLAATGAIDSIFLFLRLLRCFSSPGSPHPPYVFRRW